MKAKSAGTWPTFVNSTVRVCGSMNFTSPKLSCKKWKAKLSEVTDSEWWWLYSVKGWFLIKYILFYRDHLISQTSWCLVEVRIMWRAYSHSGHSVWLGLEPRIFWSWPKRSTYWAILIFPIWKPSFCISSSPVPSSLPLVELSSLCSIYQREHDSLTQHHIIWTNWDLE